MLHELRYDIRGLTGVKPDRHKQSRMSMVSAQFEAGQVFLPEHASWLPELEAELFSFPGGRHDDQIDSISQALSTPKAKEPSGRGWRATSESGSAGFTAGAGLSCQ